MNLKQSVLYSVKNMLDTFLAAKPDKISIGPQPISSPFSQGSIISKASLLHTLKLYKRSSSEFVP